MPCRHHFFERIEPMLDVQFRVESSLISPPPRPTSPSPSFQIRRFGIDIVQFSLQNRGVRLTFSPPITLVPSGLCAKRKGG